MQAKKALPWVQRFYDETAFDTASVTDIVYSRYVVDRVEQVSSVLKNRTFFFIRDETYADRLPPEFLVRFVEEKEEAIQHLQRMKESIRYSLYLLYEYKSANTATPAASGCYRACCTCE